MEFGMQSQLDSINSIVAPYAAGRIISLLILVFSRDFLIKIKRESNATITLFKKFQKCQ